MFAPSSSPSISQRFSPGIRLFLLMLAFALATTPYARAQSNEVLPLEQVRPGMQGHAYTIFAGAQVEKFDREVIGILPNALGPRQSIILVQLKGPKVERTGVVAGMSGSPVYLEGKLAGALSLKLGIFTKDPIAGVTPISDVINPPAQNSSSGAYVSPQQPSATAVAVNNPNQSPLVAIPGVLPTGSTLQPIETPLVFSGFQAATLQQFAPQIQGYGFIAAQGGTAAPRPDDKQLAPGDMAGMVLGTGGASINSACTVTAGGNRPRVFLGDAFF